MSWQVDMQLALSDGLYFERVQRTAESTTPTGLDEFLSKALANDAMDKRNPSMKRVVHL